MLQSEWNCGAIEILTILVGYFSNSKAFADKTVEAFFIFARNFEMAIGEKQDFYKSELNPNATKGKGEKE